MYFPPRYIARLSNLAKGVRHRETVRAGPRCSCICRIRSHVPNTLSDGGEEEGGIYGRSMHAKVEKQLEPATLRAREREGGRTDERAGG